MKLPFNVYTGDTPTNGTYIVIPPGQDVKFELITQRFRSSAKGPFMVTVNHSSYWISIKTMQRMICENSH